MPDATFFPAASDPNCTLDCDEPEKATKENSNYRTVAWAGRYLQVTLMSIPPGSSIGLEAHPETDQFVRLDAGKGHVTMGPAEDDLSFQLDVEDGWSVQVPAGTWHDIINTGDEDMRLYVVYAPRPPHAGHRPGDGGGRGEGREDRAGQAPGLVCTARDFGAGREGLSPG